MIASCALRAAGACGPLSIDVQTGDETLHAVAESYFALYSTPWPHHSRSVEVDIARGPRAGLANGTFLTCAHMTVDRTPAGYFADTQYGFAVHGECGKHADAWSVRVPYETAFGEPQIGDMEDVFSLICTAGWRAEGYVPLHAGAIVKNGVCALLCAASGGGKSTLVTAMVLGGWCTLGDDKILLRHEDGVPVARSLLQTFNLEPSTQRWFDLAELHAMPRYSAWTDKRRVPLRYLRDDAAAFESTPTHVVSVTRSSERSGIRSLVMDPTETATTLLRQIVLPSDPQTARSIVGEVMRLAKCVRGVRLEIGQDAYSGDSWLQDVERALQ